MKQEDKDLLIQDLCARLLYNVKCQVHDEDYVLSGITSKLCNELYFEELDFKEYDGYISIEYCKPYLFPRSSMTEEQITEYREEIMKYLKRSADYFKAREKNKNNTDKYIVDYEEIDWLNAHHFDYRGLIEKGLAIDATGLNIY